MSKVPKQPKKAEEIGKAKTLKVDRDYLLHIEAEPLTFARFLKKIMGTEKNEDGSSISQRQLAAYLRDVGYTITQPVVHKYLSVLKLDRHLIKMIEDGELQFFIAYRLSRLTPEQRGKVLDLAQAEAQATAEETGKETPLRIYGRHIDEVKKKTITDSDLFGQLMKQSDFAEPYESVSEEHKTEVTEAQMKEIKHTIGDVTSPAELSTLLGLLKMRAVEAPDQESGRRGKIKPSDLQMYAAQSEHVLNAIQTISNILREALEREGYNVVR